LKVGDPRELATDVGPIIDPEAKACLDRHIATMKKKARRVWYAGEAPPELYVAPHIFELDRPEALTQEVFGPILHVVRYAESKLPELVQAIAASGYGLTLGIHSRIQSTVDDIVARLPVGNVYVNRNMIGAVVGVQPFGGHGLSGTGPKAGGPHYLPRFATEQMVTINTAAAGGNASLFSEE
jgi:RHH-type proline utilization regulon transcriptional repressor/proline dehydrogenase/delta 1-pyrroline-5-carboxylate dehydrogenase